MKKITHKKRPLFEKNGNFSNLKSSNKILDQFLSLQNSGDKRKSRYSKKIKTFDDLLKNIKLRNQCKRIFGWGNDLISGHFYTYETEEKDEELILLLEDLGFLKADWDKFKKQTIELYGRRQVTIKVNGDKAIEFFDIINGKKTKIKRATLEMIAKQLMSNVSENEFFDLLEDYGVPKSFFQYDEDYPTDNEWIIVRDILFFYSSSSNPKDQKVVSGIIKETVDPIRFSGNEEKALKVQDELNYRLWHDGYCFNNGKIIQATEELMRTIKNRRAERKEEDPKPKIENFNNTTKERNIEKIPIPKNIEKWDKIFMQLFGDKGLNGIKIQILGDSSFEHKTDFEKLGFKNLRTEKFEVKKSWSNFLYVLAMNNGKYSMKDFLPKSQKKEKDRRIQWKKEIKNNFICAFGIHSDPICWDRIKKEYVAKFKIIPRLEDRKDLDEPIDEIAEIFEERQKPSAIRR